MNNQLIQEAVECYGMSTVSTVMEIVSLSDPDSAYTLFGDEGMWAEAECVEILYFGE